MESIFGTQGNDTLAITGIDQFIDGGAGDDVLYAGFRFKYGEVAPTDTLRGGAGSDTFVIMNGTDNIVIDDFDPSKDRLLLDRAAFPGATFVRNGSWVAGVGLNFYDQGLKTSVTLKGIQSTNFLSTEAVGFILRGTNASDTLIGDVENDSIVGYEGENSIRGGWGYDTISGGSGADTLDGGGQGMVGVFGGDVLTYLGAINAIGLDLATGKGHAGDAKGDVVANFEKVVGSRYNDTITGFNGMTIDGGDGADSLVASNGAMSNTIFGGSGADTLIGSDARELLSGGDGDDKLLASGGADTVNGGAGHDNIVQALYWEYDVIDGGDGVDTLDYGQTYFASGQRDNPAVGLFMYDRGVRADLTSGRVEKFSGYYDGVFDTLSNVENLIGTSLHDTLTGNSGANRLEGGAGDDLILFGAGKDTVYGGDGADMIDEAFGVINFNDANWLDGGAGADTIFADGGNDTAMGGLGDDRLHGEGGDDLILFGAGRDTVYGGVGADMIDEAFGLSYYSGANWLDGGAGADTIFADGGNDTIVGGLGDDRLHGEMGGDLFVFEASFGRDTIADFISGADKLQISTSAIADWATLLRYSVFDSANNGLSVQGASKYDSILLYGVTKDGLKQSDVIFV